MPLLDRAGGRGEALELRLLIEAKRVNINLLVKRREITGRKLKKGGCGVGWDGVGCEPQKRVSATEESVHIPLLAPGRFPGTGEQREAIRTSLCAPPPGLLTGRAALSPLMSRHALQDALSPPHSNSNSKAPGGWPGQIKVRILIQNFSLNR